jgi:hypothetical protein
VADGYGGLGWKCSCSITQWCGTPWNELAQKKELNTEANRYTLLFFLFCFRGNDSLYSRILVGRTLELLHDFGVAYGDSFMTQSDLRHVIVDVQEPWLSPEDVRNGKAPCYVVGFGEALIGHECARKLPVLPLDSLFCGHTAGCKELTNLTYALGFMNRSNKCESFSPTCLHLLMCCSKPATYTSKAIQWHDEDSKRFPWLPNSAVLIARRARLFKDMPPLYPELLTSFLGDDEYAEVVVEQTEPEEELESVEDGYDGLTEAPEDDAGVPTASPKTVAVESQWLVNKQRLLRFVRPCRYL